jgi:hypothetical protein
MEKWEDERNRPAVRIYECGGPGGLRKNRQQQRADSGSRAHPQKPATADPGVLCPFLSVLTMTPRHVHSLPIRLRRSPHHAASLSIREFEITPIYTIISKATLSHSTAIVEIERRERRHATVDLFGKVSG